MQRKYVYINDLEYGSIFQTQVLDWLHLYSQNGINFEILQVFQARTFLKPADVFKKLSKIRQSTGLPVKYTIMLPFSLVFTSFINAFLLYMRLVPTLLLGHEILIFSRSFIGREIRLIKKISFGKVRFIFDARAASAEEKKYIAALEKDYSKATESMINKIFYLESVAVDSATKVFCVSNNLGLYYEKMYKTPKDKIILYPCLSDGSKFYFDPGLRKKIREELKISDAEKIFIYAGGINAKWHLSAEMFEFFSEIIEISPNAKFLFLTNEQDAFEAVKNKYPRIINNIIYFNVHNSDVVKYLNAADYGLLFRENTIMNNVASPTKFAEYMLCGLPVLISEGVGDYTAFVSKYNVGYVFNQEAFNDWKLLNLKEVTNKEFDRNYISEIGKKHFSKEGRLNSLLITFQGLKA